MFLLLMRMTPVMLIKLKVKLILHSPLQPPSPLITFITTPLLKSSDSPQIITSHPAYYLRVRSIGSNAFFIRSHTLRIVFLLFVIIVAHPLLV